ncbi:MAG: LysM peptidoglycan-binding domain-containing protein [Myxococcota bacterium]
MLSPRHLLPAGSVLCLGLATCGSPAEDEAPEPPSATAPTDPEDPAENIPEPEPEPFVEHEVAEGQTLWDIAQAYDITVDKIMRDNELRPRDVRRLRKGAVLRIVGVEEARDVPTASDRQAAEAAERAALPELEDGAYHFLGDGETIWDLARTYDKTVDEIMAANEFTDDDVRSFRPGRAIAIPGIRPSQVRAAERRRAERPRERRGIRHEMAEGETIWDLAGAFQVGVSEIMAANGLSTEEVTRLRPGTQLYVPGVSADQRGRVTRRETPAQRRASALARRLGLGTRGAASSLLRGRVSSAWQRAAGGQQFPGTLRWPVTNGWFVRGYGSGEGGYHLAVDIAGEIGWNVRAAAPGIVGYSGNEVRGYGNMVIVVHPGGCVTMYAHNSSNFVVAGQRVPRGGVLAEVGSTGISRGPHVHFEFIYGGQNCDPAALFRPGIRHRNGRRTPIEPASWLRAASRPERVRCAPRRRHPRSRWVVNE